MKLKRLSENYNKDPPWFNRAIKSPIQEKKKALSIDTEKAKTTSSYYNT